MQGLSKQNIQTITDTIDRSEISFSHLREDLIDHVCCEIEARLEAGVNFQKAFTDIKQNLEIKSLQQVQEKTLLLIDKNYCTMKTTMKLSGIFSTILVIIGTLFKINHWPFGSIIISLGFLVLCFLFLPSAYYIMHREKRDSSLIFLFVSAFLGSFGFLLGILFKVNHWPGGAMLLSVGVVILIILFFPALLRYLLHKATNGKEKTAYVFAVMSGILFFAGFLFKLMHWPGGSIMQLVSTVSIVGLFIPIYTYVRYSKSEKVEVSFIYLIAAVTWICMFGMLAALNKGNNVEKDMNCQMESLQQQNSILVQSNVFLYEQSKTSNKAKSLEETKQIANDLDNYIHALKLEIIGPLSKNDQAALSSNGHINMAMLPGNTNTSNPYKVLIGENQSGKAWELKAKLDATQKEFIKLVRQDEKASALIKSCFPTELPTDAPPWIESWEELYFKHVSVMGSLEILTSFQRNLRLAEKEVIEYLLNS